LSKLTKALNQVRRNVNPLHLAAELNIVNQSRKFCAMWLKTVGDSWLNQEGGHTDIKTPSEFNEMILGYHPTCQVIHSEKQCSVQIEYFRKRLTDKQR